MSNKRITHDGGRPSLSQPMKPLSLLTRIIVWLFWRQWKAGQ